MVNFLSLLYVLRAGNSKRSQSRDIFFFRVTLLHCSFGFLWLPREERGLMPHGKLLVPLRGVTHVAQICEKVSVL